MDRPGGPVRGEGIVDRGERTLCELGGAEASGGPGWAGALRALVARCRPAWLTAGVLLAVLSLSRAGLLAARQRQLAGTSRVEVGRCLLLGVRYDAMPVGYAVLPLLAAGLAAPAGALAGRRGRRLLLAYATFATVTFLGTEIGGAGFFLRYGRRLNWMTFGYAHRETLDFIWRNYPLWAALPVLAGLFWLWGRLYGRWFRVEAGGLRAGAVARVVAAAVLLPLCALACRGGPQHRPLDEGSARVSRNELLNRLARNNFCTVYDAAKAELTGGRDEAVEYGLPLPPAAGARARAMYLLGDELPLEHARNVLWRRSVSARAPVDWNVVLIVMESMAGKGVGALGDPESQTPNLDALCAEGLLLERMYAAGSRTSRALVATLCGHPDLTGRTILKRPEAQGRYLSLAGLLRGRGYRTAFFYGGRSEFDNMGEFLAAAGVDEVVDQDDMPGRPTTWGVPDEYIFRRAHERLTEFHGQPFFAAILTLSNHEPYDVPAGRVPLLPVESSPRAGMINGLRYSDWALGEFFREARSAGYFANTLFVLVGDHGRELNQKVPVDVPGFRVPCLFYAPHLLPPGRLGTTASQTDLPPTVLGLLGGTYDHCFLGRDVLRVPADDGFALLHEDRDLAFVRGGRAVTIGPGPRLALFDLAGGGMSPLPVNGPEADVAADLAGRLRAAYGIAKHLHDTGAYGPPKAAGPAGTDPRASALKEHE